MGHIGEIRPAPLGRMAPGAGREPTARLSFALPPVLALRVPSGRWSPCVHGVRLDVGTDGVVIIDGFDGLISTARPAVLDQARRFLAAVLDRHTAAMAPIAVTAELASAVAGSGGAEQPELFSVIFGARAAIARREHWHPAPVLV